MKVSVVIPTHNRSALVVKNVSSLCNQSYPSADFEVIVVADGCMDDTVDALKKLSTPFSLTVVEQPGGGPSVARNRGVALAKGDLLIFLDDDIEPTPTLVEAHVRAHRLKPGHVVIGYCPPLFKEKKGFFSICMLVSWENMFSAMHRIGHRYTYRDLISGNFSIESALFSRIGGFDPAFWCQEDSELGLRLIKSGIPFFFASDAVGYHYETSDLNRSLKRKYEEGRADVLMGYRHPDVISVLPLCRLRLWLLGYIAYVLVFRWPKTGRVVSFLLKHILYFMEKLGLRYWWQRILGFLNTYWYWCGVAEELGTEQALEGFLKSGLSKTGNGSEVEIDLAEGLDVVGEKLDMVRPEAVSIYYRGRFVGRIPHEPGAELLGSVHLRSVLAGELAWPFLRAIMVDGVLGRLGYGGKKPFE